MLPEGRLETPVNASVATQGIATAADYTILISDLILVAVPDGRLEAPTSRQAEGRLELSAWLSVFSFPSEWQCRIRLALMPEDAL